MIGPGNPKVPSPNGPRAFIGWSTHNRGLRASAQLCTFLLVLVVCVLCLCATALAANAKQELSQAEAYISRLGHETLSILLDTKSSKKQKRKDIARILDSEVNFGLVSVFVLGSYWKKITPNQRSAYQALFKKFEISGLSTRLLNYPVKRFKIVSSEFKGRSDILVHTEIVRLDRPPFVPAWRVRRLDDGFMIIDLHYEGTSLAFTRRSEFQSVLDDSGFEGLMEKMKGAVDRLN